MVRLKVFIVYFFFLEFALLNLKGVYFPAPAGSTEISVTAPGDPRNVSGKLVLNYRKD